MTRVSPVIDKELSEIITSGDEDVGVFKSIKKSQKAKKGSVKDIASISSDLSKDSASETLLSSHAMRMGLYSINLGTKFGQNLHAIHMLILPLIPVFILLAQNGNNFYSFHKEAGEILSVQGQVSSAMDLSTLIKRLQDERASVALNIFLKRSPSDDLQDLQQLVTNKMDIRRFSLIQTFNATDTVLQLIKTWPDSDLVFFQSKLKFQIQHSIFRTKIREGEKGIFDVLSWYNEIIRFLLDYISLSIHDSDVSDFYRYIIAFKNLLRAVEFSGKSGIYALRYFSSDGVIESEHFHKFLRFEKLRKEYLNQTFNFLPRLREGYDRIGKGQYYEEAQNLVRLKKGYEKTNNSVKATVDYFSRLMEYTYSTSNAVIDLTAEIEKFVQAELTRFENHKTVPMGLLILLIIFVPIVAYVTLQATTSLFSFSEIYNERVKIHREEKLKTDKILTDLLPESILRQVKKGKVVEPESFTSVSIFLCDIVGFTNLASESTAHQIVSFLNTLYNLFDLRLENYDVYKVETIGDAYMVASGVPDVNDHHATELSKMALDLLAKVVTFEVQHKPGYRIKLRMGIHTGSCVAGVVGTKIPHYSVFGETVEIAGFMESTGHPMKIQITKTTKDLLERDGTFNYIPRDGILPEKLTSIGITSTYWLIGRSSSDQPNGLLNIKKGESQV